MTTSPPGSSVRVIKPRSPDFVFDAVPPHWMGGSPFATQLINGVNLLFPAGERFFVRSVRRYLDQVEPELAAQARGFFGQEGRHARAHEDFFEALTRQGYPIASFLSWYERMAYKHVEPAASPVLRLAVTAALEHYTAIMAEGALRDGFLDAHAHEAVRDLLKWHACEEIEHKAVAFDVLQRVDPRYRTRVAGMALGTLLLLSFWAVATGTLLLHDRRQGVRKFFRLGNTMPLKGLVTEVFYAGIRDYLRRDFHPDQRDNQQLARDYLVAAGFEPAAV
ncbi:MAG: metal-dependent hydrolase [Myxococcales bacterium]|nr:metal-dependent hydrolase [Myxococcales bacterium]